jgi:hypothetical protein
MLRGLLASNGSKTGRRRAFEKLGFPLGDLIGVDIELLRQLGERLLSLHRGQSHLRLEGCCVVPARSLAHGCS